MGALLPLRGVEAILISTKHPLTSPQWEGEWPVGAEVQSPGGVLTDWGAVSMLGRYDSPDTIGRGGMPLYLRDPSGITVGVGRLAGIKSYHLQVHCLARLPLTLSSGHSKQVIPGTHMCPFLELPSCQLWGAYLEAERWAFASPHACAQGTGVLDGAPQEESGKACLPHPSRSRSTHLV